jgi:16S rRNA (cytidine1402-2'-O)-methyltransferase
VSGASKTGTLYLMPTPLGGEDALGLLPASTLDVLGRIRHFVAENPRTARAFLKAARYPAPVQEAHIATLNAHTPDADLQTLLEPLLTGDDCAVLSEAGCPGVADPGAALVRLAHERAIPVKPLVGPSALLLALMSAGMNGQSFAFHGYLPIGEPERARRLVEIECESEARQVTQLFIEAPYRNDALLEAILQTCRPDTLLGVACDLTLPTEYVRTRRIAEWSPDRPRLNRRPTVFLLFRERLTSGRARELPTRGRARVTRSGRR